ncbi:MAG: SpoIIE family protein phosphatase [Deltaproteobacteria bacterium]|nr:SpoIIE family protein phosphatase [Deltaproteobacteria bacterium]MBW2137315.1 SpoIIE family protein phosphatase [Deltaproteobacteria bacterium]
MSPRKKPRTKTREGAESSGAAPRGPEGEVEALRARLNDLEKACEELTRRCEEQEAASPGEGSQKGRIEEALKIARIIINQSPVILFRRLAGDDPTLVYVSDNITRFGYGPEDFLSGTIRYADIVHPEDVERTGAEITEYAAKDIKEYTQIYRIITKQGDIRWVEDHTSVVEDPEGGNKYNQGIIVDITERKVAEDKLRKSEEKFRRIVETAAEGFILTDENHRIADVNDAYCRLLGYSREEVFGKMPFDLATDEFRAYVTANRNAILSQEYRELEGALVAKDGREVPVLLHGNTLRDDQGNVIGNMAFITDMTEHKKALALAAEVQKNLLPQESPTIDGLDIAGRSVSCEEVGGDYFDYLWGPDFPNGTFAVVVGDISGHGVDAALLMTAARAFLRMRASKPGSLSQIVTEMNQYFTMDILDTGSFMTLFLLALDPGKDLLKWVRAGHEPALVYDPSRDRFEELRGRGVSLGLDEKYHYDENQKQGLPKGSIIAIGTDGIWESMNSKGEMFGKGRFMDIIRGNAGRDADHIIDAVYGDVRSFSKGLPLEDDVTLVVIKLTQALTPRNT